jgi:hypothetical protein
MRELRDMVLGIKRDARRGVPHLGQMLRTLLILTG